MLIDRKVDRELAPQSQGWGVSALEFAYPTLEDNPGDPAQMTQGVTALQPVQPTVLTSSYPISDAFPVCGASQRSFRAASRMWPRKIFLQKTREAVAR